MSFHPTIIEKVRQLWRDGGCELGGCGEEKERRPVLPNGENIELSRMICFDCWHKGGNSPG